MENVHEKHRERLRKLYRTFGIDSFSDHEVLEMLLYFTIPRKDTNETAHNLINAFGCLSSVFEAKPHDLLTVDGIGQKSADHIAYIGSVIRAYENDKAKQFEITKERPALDNPETMKNIIKSYFSGMKNEVFYLVFLNTRKKVIYSEKFAEGTLDTVEIYTRNVVTSALRANAHSVILAHNHLSGNPAPSNADLSTTKAIQKALWTVDIYLVDHFVIGGDNITSMREQRLIDPII